MILRRATITVCLLVLALGAGFCDDALMGRYDSQQMGYTEEKLEAPLMLTWQYTAARFRGNTAAPVIAGNSVYFAAGDCVYCVDLYSGNFLWRYPQEQSLTSTVKATPAINGDYLYFGTGDGKLYCLDRYEGKFEWFFETRGALRCPPVIDSGTMFLGSNDNSIYAIDAETGDMVWPKPFTARDDFANGIAVGSGMVVGSSMDGNFYGINQSSGKLRWIFRLPSAPVKTSPIIADNVAIIAVGNVVYGLTARSGQARWMIQLPSDASTTPASDGVDLFVPCRDKKLYCYNISGRTPALKWTQPADIGAVCSSSPTVTDEIVFVTAARGIVAGFSTIDGSLKWRYIAAPSGINTPGATFTDALTSPVIANGSLFVLTDDGVLNCFTKTSPDTAPPDPFFLTPANGVRMSGAPPIKISAALWDAGSGVDFGSATLTLDGESKDYEIDYSTSTVSFSTEIGDSKSPVKPLKDGSHVIALTVKDYAGNQLTQEWTFVADSSMPPPRRVIKEPAKSTKEPERVDRTRTETRDAQGDQGQSGQPPSPPPPPSMGAPGAPGVPGFPSNRSDRWRGRGERERGFAPQAMPGQ